jgi:hypothetical protein
VGVADAVTVGSGVGLAVSLTEGTGAGTSGASDGGSDSDGEGFSVGGVSEDPSPPASDVPPVFDAPSPVPRFDRAAAAQALRPAASTVASSPVPVPDFSESPSSPEAGISVVAALDAGTPADRTSTAPNAAAAVPRRSPPWKPVSERKPSDF